MHALALSNPCIRACSLRTAVNSSARRYSSTDSQPQPEQGQNAGDVATTDNAGKEEGALTRRLREMSEEAVDSGGQGVLKNMGEAGFSADLKAQLEQRIAAANLRSSEANLPASASRHTRDLTTAEPWTGTESIHDASLRMLNDAHKPMRLGRPPRIPGVKPPQTVDTGHKRNKEGRGLRLANARDRSSVYMSAKDAAAEAEREKRFQELKERFEPHARIIVPDTIQGLASLANKRIEDAIARGQFKNIPRGRGKNVERDHNASSPFIDTTEYFMNKIIQKQEIVPPWIEKQQEVTSAANKFRTRLRADWKRHAARMIASKGGSMEDQLRRAEGYAKAELISNPVKRKQETLTVSDSQGHLSQISLSGELKVAKENSPGAETVALEEITAERVTLDPASSSNPQNPAEAKTVDSSQTIEVPVAASASGVPPTPYPFRDPQWERTEHGYLVVAIKDLNDKARSYNLQAPELAKRPYFKLERELNSCYADVAPLLAEAILERARKPAAKIDGWHGTRERTVLDSIVGGPVRVRDEKASKQYGFKQFWKDLWAEKPSSTY